MKISIITITYNSAATVCDTIKTVLSQTYKDIEYIVIDGNSSDGTQEILRKAQPEFEGRMRYVSEPDKGIYDAMNKGIALCTGDVIGILNSDDYYTSDDIVERIAHEFSRNDIDAVYGDIHFIRDGEPNKITRYYSSKLFRPFLLRFGFMPAHPSFYVRKQVYADYGGYATDYKIAADYDMMVRLFHKHHIKAKYISKDFVTMRTGGLSTKNVKNRLIITREDVIACRRNGMYTNTAFISVKYLYKIFGFLFPSRKQA
jgi:glycosyltransferase involved in cell wall biosynthesis